RPAREHPACLPVPPGRGPEVTRRLPHRGARPAGAESPTPAAGPGRAEVQALEHQRRLTPALFPQLVDAGLGVVQVLVPKVAVDTLDQGDAGPGNPGPRGDVVARHECLTDPQVADAVDRDFVPHRPEAFSCGDRLDPVEPLGQTPAVEWLLVAA